jgi:solute carrier family 25 (peroxisomal adenine nucleotide transporter), member 17
MHEDARQVTCGSFLQGTVPSLIMVANPTIQYMLYEWGAQWWRRGSLTKAAKATQLSAGEVFLISGLAKLGATLATYPLLVIKNRAQVRTAHVACTACIGLHSTGPRC